MGHIESQGLLRVAIAQRPNTAATVLRRRRWNGRTFPEERSGAAYVSPLPPTITAWEGATAECPGPSG